MVVILMPTVSCGVMPSRVQAVPRSEALVSLSSASSTICRTLGPSTLKRWTTLGSSVQITGESVFGGEGAVGAFVAGGGGGLARPEGTVVSWATPTALRMVRSAPSSAVVFDILGPFIRREN